MIWFKAKTEKFRHFLNTNYIESRDGLTRFNIDPIYLRSQIKKLKFIKDKDYEEGVENKVDELQNEIDSREN